MKPGCPATPRLPVCLSACLPEASSGVAVSVQGIPEGREAAAPPPLRFCARYGYLIALISSPLVVSPLSSQKNVPPRPCAFLKAIFVPMVSGVS